jgi:DNA-directed RNA polymerase specialized sigma24 family protein
VALVTGQDGDDERHTQRRAQQCCRVARWFAARSGADPEAVDGLLRAVFPTARRFAARSCTSRENAEDAVQDALTALVRRVATLRAAETVTSWLFVTIRHACLRRMPGVVLVPIDLAGADLAGDVVDRVVVAAALAALPATQREVIVLVDLLDLSVERTARQLGIGVRAAKSRLHRARRALAAVIGQPELRRSA